MSGGQAHVPVLLAETIAALAPRDDALYLDGTFGAGGYAEALLNSAQCRVVALDRDPQAVREGDAMTRRYAGRLTVIEGRFAEMERLLHPLGVRRLAGVTLDLGLSSTQLDDPTRGFTFRVDGPLDMRMSPAGATAADLVNTAPESELAAIIRDYGEERYCPPHRARHGRRAADHPHRRARRADPPRGASDGGHRSRDAHLPGAAHRGQ